MSKLSKLNALAVTVVAGVFAASSVQAGNPFSAADLSAGYQLAGNAEGKCGEAKCGADSKKAEEGKCGEAKCGADSKKAEEGKCGEAKCGADSKKAGEGKCGEGKCGSQG